MGARLLPQSFQYPNLSEGADRVAGQLRGDKIEWPFSGVTKSGRVWRKVPESDARSGGGLVTGEISRTARIISTGLNRRRDSVADLSLSHGYVAL